MILHGYWRSSAAYRVRIALALKGLDHEQVLVHLTRGGGEQLSEAFAALNPQRLVPALELDGGAVLTQSMAIVEYLEETCPEPALLPADVLGRARVRALAQSIACEIHPLNNLRVLRYLVHELGLDDAAKTAWYRHWVQLGFEAFERALAGSDDTGTYCHGDAPTLADVCLMPQIYNAQRFDVGLEPYPTIRRVAAACAALPAFAGAAPEAQPDAG